MEFRAGQTVLRRCLYRSGRFAAVDTARVVADGPAGVLTWTGPGSQVVRRSTLDGEPVRKMPLAEREAIPTMLTPTVWRETSVLILTPPKAAHSVWWFFDAEGRFQGWYVNLEQPSRRWPDGLDTADHALDIWVEPDRTWEWKDEDEFAERTGHPEYWTAEQAAEIKAEALRIVPLIEAGAFPFDGTHTGFEPGPAWEPTRLPPHWDLPGRP
ncbi:DUF402 domain-containing protein [Nonomuraea sp. NPDC050328]|uniref:DUF402 domain-containing protein n=1 Tax=Nonomuraea sp. NPDC050328 TaxID=3364361 RepID=UPI0037AB445B